MFNDACERSAMSQANFLCHRCGVSMEFMQS